VIAISTNASNFKAPAAWRATILVIALVAVAAFPAFAGAASPTTDQYTAVLQQVGQGNVPPTPPPPNPCIPDSDSSSGTASGSGSGSSSDDCAPPSAGLPFTGLDVIGLGAVALFLTLGGIALRRARFAESTQA
jgi:hypothetical protein